MKKSESVYNLARGLNNIEKKAFRKVVGQKAKGKAYLELYIFLNKMDVYDEEKLLTKFPNKAQLAANIGYLYEKIIESLRITKHESALVQLLRAVEEYKILYNKGLYDLGLKVALQAYQTAMKFEYWSHAKDIIIELDGRSSMDGKGLQKSLKTIIELEQNYLHYFIAYYHPIMTLVEKSMPLREQADIDYLNQLLASDFLQNPAKAISSRAKMLRFASLKYGYTAIGNSLKSIEFARKAIEFFKQNSFLKEEYWRTNLIFKGCLLQNLFELDNAAEELEQLAIEIEAEISERSNCNDLYVFLMGVIPSYFLTKGNNKEKAIYWMQKLEAIFYKIEKEIEPVEVQVYHTNRIRINYLLKDYEKALDHALEIRAIGKNTRVDIYAWVKIWYLIINFELKKWKHLKSESWANYYSISRNNPNAKVEKVCTLFFKKIAKYLEENNNKNALKTFTKLKEDLTQLKKWESEAIYLEELEIFNWIDKQIGLLQDKEIIS